MHHKVRVFALVAFAVLLLTGCVENTVPYPYVKVDINEFILEFASGVYLSKRVSGDTVHFYVSDSVDLKRVKLYGLKLAQTNPVPTVSVLDSARCADYSRFPRMPFDNLQSLPVSANTSIDFSDTLHAVRFRFTTFQEYDVKVQLHQVVKRDIQIDGMQTEPVIDAFTHRVVIYVSSQQPLSRLAVKSFNLGGAHGQVTPNPADSDTFDFSEPRTFMVQHFWETEPTEWTVYVFRRDLLPLPEAYGMTRRAMVMGKMPSDATLAIEYRDSLSDEWLPLPSEDIKRSSLGYSAVIKGLTPKSNYFCRAIISGSITDAVGFSTTEELPLPNGSFDEWNLTGDEKRPMWCPWAQGATSFWDTGNQGATTVGPSNSTPTDETCDGIPGHKAAKLQSKYIVIKFAAGNIFTGTYKKTDGTNGILDFGRPFEAFPTKLRVNYKYTAALINRTDESHEYLKGRPDSCQIYVALTDWDEPFEVRTRPSNLNLFSVNDPHVIAYAEIIKGEDVPEWTQVDLELQYRSYRCPKHLLIVASSSKYGDFFTGGEGATLWVDNFELIYE